MLAHFPPNSSIITTLQSHAKTRQAVHFHGNVRLLCAFMARFHGFVFSKRNKRRNLKICCALASAQDARGLHHPGCRRGYCGRNRYGNAKIEQDKRSLISAKIAQPNRALPKPNQTRKRTSATSLAICCCNSVTELNLSSSRNFSPSSTSSSSP